MDRNIYSNSKKFLILLVIICLVFFVAVIKAFEYLPDENKQDVLKRATIDEINKPAVSVTTETSNDEDLLPKEEEEAPTAVQKEQTQNERTSVSKKEETKDIEPLENINSENASEPVSEKIVELTPQEKADKIFAEAQKYKDEKQYVKALEEYKKIPTVTTNVKTIAKSYEEAATIYAIVKRYGTALAYAQKAYNMSPSSSREILLARLYYKVGDMDKATRRVNNVLQRDFSADR